MVVIFAASVNKCMLFKYQIQEEIGEEGFSLSTFHVTPTQSLQYEDMNIVFPFDLLKKSITAKIPQLQMYNHFVAETNRRAQSRFKKPVSPTDPVPPSQPQHTVHTF